MKTGKHLGKKSKKVSIVFFIRIILFVIAVLCVINITKWVCENQKNKNILSDINKNRKYFRHTRYRSRKIFCGFQKFKR